VTTRPPRDMAASVHQRLLNVAKGTNRRFIDVLQYYAMERWLYRLSQSKHADRFVLKGALMLLVWRCPLLRPTRDIDLLGRIGNDPESVRSVMIDICQTPVEDDGLIFDVATVTTERIAEEAEYSGTRASFRGGLGRSRIAMQIDIGFSDVVTPGPTGITYPTILDHPPATLLAYNRETAIAEKLEAMLKLGELNSRMKDFFDVWSLAGSFDFAGPALARAVQQTLERRGMRIDTQPVCFTDGFAADAAKTAQWKAFAGRIHLTEVPAGFPQIMAAVRAFLQPVLTALASGRAFDLRWRAGGSWQAG
jgi:predicted nucleotidyltransferase component of viral defense system